MSPPSQSPDPSQKSGPDTESLAFQLKSFGRLWPYLWSAGYAFDRTRILAAIALTILGQFVLVLAPFGVGASVDAVQAALDDEAVWAQVAVTVAGLVLGYGALRMLSIVFSEAREYIFAPVGQRAQREVATQTFAHLHRLSLRYHLEKRTGGLSRIIERGIRSIDFLFRFLLFNIGPTLLLLVFSSVALWATYSWVYAAIAFCIVVIYFVFTIVTTEWRLKFRREMNRQDTEANAKAIDSLLNFETVKYFNAEHFETGRYDKAMARYQNAAIKSRTSLATVNIGQYFLMNVGVVALLILAAYHTIEGEMQIGSMTTITLLMAQIYRPLNILGFAYREIKQALIDMEKMFSLLDITPEVTDRDAAKDITDLNRGKVQGAITFENVAFRYDADRPILKDASFDIKPGETVAVVGPTGAGKSTLSRILFRFYDIEAGCVRVDGHDIQDITQNSLRRAIGIVPQDTVLFNDTIGYNIGYAKPDASQADIEAAAQSAQIHDFIAALPNGYDTMVGERGLKLSGGEKQRVAIARTLLKNPAILILDEATSALDSVTERDIQAALDAVSRNRTTLVIAHRLSTIVNANKIIVMKDGMIDDIGTHDILRKKRGLYAALWEQQERGEHVAPTVSASPQVED